MLLHRISALVLITAAACSGNDGSDGSDGIDGVNYLTGNETEPAGDNCAHGGVRLTSGPDSDRNGTLDEIEIVVTNYVCNGADGTGLDAGASGQPLLLTSPATPAQCPTGGGVQIVTGVDANGDGDLSDPGEATGTPQVVCNGVAASLVAAATEPNGANCAAGGVRIQNGGDTNANGVLEPNEVAATSFACTDPRALNGSAPIVLSATRPAVFPEPDTTIYVPAGPSQVLQTAMISVPTPGSILAIATTNVYCDNSALAGSQYNCADAPAYTYANFTVGQDGVGEGMGTSGTYTRISLTPGTEVTMTTTEVFMVPAGGPYIFEVAGSVGIDNGPDGGTETVSVAYQLTDLTLLFIPGSTPIEGG
jgi:hypothetical protein